MTALPPRRRARVDAIAADAALRRIPPLRRADAAAVQLRRGLSQPGVGAVHRQELRGPRDLGRHPDQHRDRQRCREAAFWLDGNIHAAELTACTTCLYYLHDLLSKYGTDPQATHLLDTRTIYMVPRLNPDGAELALADRPRHIRSSTRPYPFDEEPVEGLSVEDIDGDGRILTMRIADPHGGYKHTRTIRA